MLNFDLVHSALISLWQYKLRSALTMLGMCIGVFAVVTLVSVGQGAKRYVLGEFESMGKNIIIIQPGKSDTRSKLGPPVGSAKRKMTLDDVTALQKKAFHLEAVSGITLGSAQIKYEDSLANISIFGANEQFFQIIAIAVGTGRMFSSEEDSAGRRVVVLGYKIAQKLFGEDYPVGRSVKINQTEFKVIGVLASAGDKLGFNLDEFAFVPTRSAMRLFNEDKLFGIRAKASSRVTIETAVAEIEEILRDRRNGEEDFTIVTQVAIMESLDGILGMLSYVLGAIASISMLVGGVGIMNITLVSVAERTQEIGVRRSVGASRSDIMWQFFSESLMLSFISGLFGILGAVLITFSVGLFYPSFDMSPPAWIYLPAFLMAVLIGSFFGVWPARKAANIQILDALRHE
jgi:putative ABC transport system permease protein